MQNLMALLAEADGGDGAGGGAPGGGSPEGGQDDKPKDGEFVPKTQFIAALNSAERKREAEVATLRAELAELGAQVKAKPTDQPKRLNRADLKAAVEAGQISQDQADAEIDRQHSEDAENRAHRVALETVSAVERKRLVDSEVARYKAVAPEILDDAHDTRKSIREAFSGFVELGDDPRDVVTQLKAIRSVLGPIGRLEKARSGTAQHETHRETGGSSGGDQQKPKNGKLVDQLNAGSKAHYEDGIKRGRYKDWAAVEDELKYASTAVRQRLGIAA
jgi:hypothetical protein